MARKGEGFEGDDDLHAVEVGNLAWNLVVHTLLVCKKALDVGFDEGIEVIVAGGDPVGHDDPWDGLGRILPVAEVDGGEGST